MTNEMPGLHPELTGSSINSRLRGEGSKMPDNTATEAPPNGANAHIVDRDDPHYVDPESQIKRAEHERKEKSEESVRQEKRKDFLDRQQTSQQEKIVEEMVRSGPFRSEELEILRRALYELSKEGKINDEYLNALTERTKNHLSSHLGDSFEANELLKGLERLGGIAAMRKGVRDPEQQIIIDQYNSLPDEEREQYLIDVIPELPLASGYLDMSLVKLIVKHPGALNRLLYALLATPLDQETGRYQLGFQEGINTSLVISVLKSRENISRADRKIYKYALAFKESIELFHSMNKEIVTGNLEGFLGISQAIRPEHLDFFQRVLGASTVMRFFEQEYQRLMAVDGWVNNKNYGRMMGLELEEYEEVGESGEKQKKLKVTGQYVGSIEERFKEFVVNARKDGIKGFEKMQNWEVTWAFQAGKILHNLSLRPAEMIATGHVPGGNEQFASFPQESMVRMMGWLRWMTRRFQVSDVQGGIVFEGMVENNIREDRTELGYSQIGITHLGGREVDDFEMAGAFGLSGIHSSWRQALITLRHVPIPEIAFEPGNPDSPVFRSLGDALDFGVMKWPPEDPKRPENKVGEIRAKREFLRRLFLTVDPATNRDILRPEINNALGVLLRNSNLLPEEEELESEADKIRRTDKHQNNAERREFNKLKEQIRVLIWERAASENPLAMVNFLHGIKFGKGEKKKEGKYTVNTNEEPPTIKIFGKGGVFDEGGQFKDVRWEELSDKLFRLNEIRLSRIRYSSREGGNPQDLGITLQDVIRQQNGLETGIKISDKEQEFLDYIKQLVTEGDFSNGNKFTALNKELANVRFPTNPFMNDVVWEEIEYGEAGAEFYRRREVGDLTSYHKAHEAFIKLMANPGSLSVAEAGELFKAIVDGIAGPNGLGDGQRRTLPMVMAFFELVERGGLIENKVLRWLMKSEIINGIWNISRRPTSIAQKYSGLTALSLSEFDMFKHLEDYMRLAIFNAEMKKKFIKRFGGFWRILRALFREMLPLIIFSVMKDEITKPFTEVEEFKS